MLIKAAWIDSVVVSDDWLVWIHVPTGFISSLLQHNVIPTTKWGLTFNNFTQPQSISHFSSTRPQWELLKRDSNSKSSISHRAKVNPTGLRWFSDTQIHTRIDAWFNHFTIRISQTTDKKVLAMFIHENSSGPKKYAEQPPLSQPSL